MNCSDSLRTIRVSCHLFPTEEPATTQGWVARQTWRTYPRASLARSYAAHSGSPQSVYVNGDLTLSGNANDFGILVVTGTLTVKGTVQWNGLVIVAGTDRKSTRLNSSH